MVKVIYIFLIFMVVMAMLGRLRLPGRGNGKTARRGRCRSCGKFRIGSGPCDCSGTRKGG